jgi:uncharacterized protein YbbK (DUF523 family)
MNNRKRAVRPRVAVSACLLGEAVRYDGRDKHEARLRSWLSGCELVPVCPEVGIGLGVPRAPIQLFEIDGMTRLADRDDPDRDHSAAMRDFARDWWSSHASPRGMVCKSRSPSCALRDAPCFDIQGRPLAQDAARWLGRGFFITSLCQWAPALPVIDEISLRDARLRARFLGRVFESGAG